MFHRQSIKLLSFKQLKATHWMIIFIVFFVAHIPAIKNAEENKNAYELLAESFYKGKITLSKEDIPFVKGTQIRDTGDLISYNGKYYLPYPPAPAILLIPLIPFEGGLINSVLIAILLSCLNIFLLYSILKKLEIGDRYIPWLIFGFFFGTSYWFVLLTSHHVYGFAEVVSVTGIFLLLNELFGRNRAILMGLFLGISFMSRQFTVFLSLFVLGYLIYYYLIFPVKRNRKTFWTKTLLFTFSLGCIVIVYCLYNYLRFGDPLDTGYKHIVFLGILRDRVSHFGVFSSHYVMYNLYNYFIKGFNIDFTGSGLMQIKDVDLFGTGLFIASPFLVASFKTNWNKFLKAFAWISIGIIFIGLLFYHNNGKDQVNASRFTLDFLPLMYILTAIGIKNIPSWLYKIMISYAIILNLIAFGIHFFFHTY